MEQKHDSVRRQARYHEIASLCIFSFLSGVIFYFSLGRLFLYPTLVELSGAVVFYLAGIRYEKLSLSSVGWLLLGISFAAGFGLNVFPSSPLAIILFILIIISGYEETRFLFTIRPIIRSAGNLQLESIERLHALTRNHSMTLLQVVALAFISSVIVTYLSVGLIIVSPAVTGVTIFVSAAIVLIILIVYPKSA